MDTQNVILGQLERLRQELNRSTAAIDLPEVDEYLRARVVARFETVLKRLQAQNSALEQRIKDKEPLDACWRGLRQLQEESTRVFDECLAFVEGAWARRHGLDEGVCALTDALLDDLARSADVPWNRFTLLATSEFYRPTAEIIRIKYPEVSLWSLPLAAHEFGHYVGPELHRDAEGGREYPLQARLKLADEARGNALHSKGWHHLQECFADVFATYTLGPAYAAAFILLRMNPADAHTDTVTHPSATARVHGILWLLDEMDKRDGARLQSGFRDVTALLRQLWQGSLEATGEPSALPAPAAALVTQRTGELLALLIDTTPERLRFGWSDWLRAQRIAADPNAKALPEESTRRDVLNAAWLARLRLAGHDPHALNDVARNAFDLYRRVSTPAHRA